MKSGLSSSVAIYVLVARVFNLLYELNLNTMAGLDFEMTVSIPKIKLNWGCVAGGTLVTMSDGVKRPISELRAGDCVKTDRDGNAAKIKSITTGKDTVLWRVAADGGYYIDASDFHPFVTKNGIKYTLELTGDDKLLMEDGNYHRVIHRYELSQGPYDVFNLVLEDKHLFIGNGFYVGDNEEQGNAMKAKNTVSSTVSEEIIRECDLLKKTFLPL